MASMGCPNLSIPSVTCLGIQNVLHLGCRQARLIDEIQCFGGVDGVLPGGWAVWITNNLLLGARQQFSVGKT